MLYVGWLGQLAHLAHLAARTQSCIFQMSSHNFQNSSKSPRLKMICNFRKRFSSMYCTGHMQARLDWKENDRWLSKKSEFYMVSKFNCVSKIWIRQLRWVYCKNKIAGKGRLRDYIFPLLFVSLMIFFPWKNIISYR